MFDGHFRPELQGLKNKNPPKNLLLGSGAQVPRLVVNVAPTHFLGSGGLWHRLQWGCLLGKREEIPWLFGLFLALQITQELEHKSDSIIVPFQITARSHELGEDEFPLNIGYCQGRIGSNS